MIKTRAVVDSDRAPMRRRDPPRDHRHPLDQVRGADESVRGGVRQPSGRGRHRLRDGEENNGGHAGDLGDRHERNGREVQRETGEGHAREQAGADRHQGGLGGDRRGENRGGGREHARPSARVECVSMTTRMAAVAPKVRRNAGIDDGERLGGDEQRGGDGERVRGRTAEIDRASGEIDDRHERGARDRRAASNDIGVSDAG